jgi:hypothetical protein
VKPQFDPSMWIAVGMPHGALVSVSARTRSVSGCRAGGG